MRYGRAMEFVAHAEWFAVDADGHLARFDVGADGARPRGAAVGRGPEEPSFDPESLDCARLLAVLTSGHDPCEGWSPSPAPGWQVAVLDDDAPLEGFTILGDAPPRVAVSDERLDQDAADALAERARWTLPIADLHEALEGNEGVDGLYVYRRVGDAVGRYERVMVPSHPLAQSVLDEPLETHALALSFADAEVLDLADHLTDEEVVAPPGASLRPVVEAPPEPSAPSRLVWIAVAAGLVLLAVVGWLIPQ